MNTLPECPQCIETLVNAAHGGYVAHCLPCSARLLASTTPQSPQASAMLEAIKRRIKRHKLVWSMGDVKQLARELLASKKRAK
jgi:hypothetical protein